MVDNLWQDLRYGIRMLRKSPGFTAVAVLALALGIGANSAIFSVVDGVLLRPLPYQDPNRLVMVWGNNTKEGTRQQPASYEDFTDFKGQNRSFEAMAATSPRWTFNLTGGREPEQVYGMFVSASFFQVLGVAPALGRAFLPEEDRPGGARIVVASHGLWQRYFGSDPSLLGKTLTLDGNNFTIVGIMPAGFQFLGEADLWVPLVRNPILNRGRGVRFLSVIGRLKAGIALEQAQAEMETIAHQLGKQYPDSNTGIGVHLVRLHEQVTGPVQSTLLVLLGAVSFVLLVACANVANLMLTRAAARQKEIALRMALGASRGRLIRQLLTESIMLSLLGGTAGLLLAIWGIDLLLSLSPGFIPRRNEIGMDAAVLGFTVLVSLLTGISFGLAPALRASKLNLNASLKEGSRRGGFEIRSYRGFGFLRLRSLLVVSEIALTLVLLIGSGLLIRSLLRLLEVNPGFTTENVLSLGVVLPQSTYPQDQQRAAFYQQLEERIKALPEVISVGAVSRLPLRSADNNITSTLIIEGRPIPAGERPEVDFRRASTNYFQALGIPLRKGRVFTEQDGSKGTEVAIINEAMARRFWPNEDPIGKRIKLGLNAEQNPWVTIVGVVGNVRHLGLDAEPRPEVYRHYLTSPLSAPIVVVHTASDPKKLIGALRSQVRMLDRDLPISNIDTMEQIVSRSVAPRRFSMLLLSIFAAAALILAAVGTYGVISYSTTQRTHEIGIRMALGAQPRDVLKLVVGQGMVLALTGVAVGLAVAFTLTRVMSGLLYRVSATDPATFASITLLLAGVALLACYIPARRATKVDPMAALRYE